MTYYAAPAPTEPDPFDEEDLREPDDHIDITAFALPGPIVESEVHPARAEHPRNLDDLVRQVVPDLWDAFQQQTRPDEAYDPDELITIKENMVKAIQPFLKNVNDDLRYNLLLLGYILTNADHLQLYRFTPDGGYETLEAWCVHNEIEGDIRERAIGLAKLEPWFRELHYDVTKLVDPRINPQKARKILIIKQDANRQSLRIQVDLAKEYFHDEAAAQKVVTPELATLLNEVENDEDGGEEGKKDQKKAERETRNARKLLAALPDEVREQIERRARSTFEGRVKTEIDRIIAMKPADWNTEERRGRGIQEPPEFAHHVTYENGRLSWHGSVEIGQEEVEALMGHKFLFYFQTREGGPRMGPKQLGEWLNDEMAREINEQYKNF